MTPLRLSPLDVLLEAGARIGQRRAALVRSCGAQIGVALLASIALRLVNGGVQLALMLSYFALLALSAVQVHGVLAPAQLRSDVLSVRLWLRYLWWALTLFVCLGLSLTPASWMAWFVVAQEPSEAQAGAYLALLFASALAGSYCIARLCLVLPAVALQRSHVLRLAWRHSRGNGAALAVLLFLPERLYWLVSRALADGGALGVALSSVLRTLAVFAVVALLSVAWSRLAEPGPAGPTASPSGSAAPFSLGVPAAWATLLLAVPILLSHGWAQLKSLHELQALQSQTALLHRSESANQRQHDGSMAVIGGDRERALQLYEEALQLYRDAGNAGGEARTLTLIGSLQRELGNEPAARDAFTSASERARASGDASVEELVRNAESRPRASR